MAGRPAMMRRGFFIPAVIVLAAGATQVRADSNAGQALSFSGDAPPMCAITSPPAGTQAANMAVTQADLSQGRIMIDQLIDPVSATLQPASITLSFDVTCNGPHSVDIRSVKGALEPESAVTILTEGFATEVGYTAVLTWNAETLSIAADGNAATAQSDSLVQFAHTGTAELELRVDGSLNDMSRPLAEGRYIDTLVILLSPQF